MAKKIVVWPFHPSHRRITFPDVVYDGHYTGHPLDVSCQRPLGPALSLLVQVVRLHCDVRFINAEGTDIYCYFEHDGPGQAEANQIAQLPRIISAIATEYYAVPVSELEVEYR